MTAKTPAAAPDYHGHRQRLRDRYRLSGLAGMLPYEKLELLLMFAIPRRDVKPIARALLLRFKDLAGVLEASVDELQEVPGIGEQAAVLLHLVRQLGADYLETRMRRVETLDSLASTVNFARMKIGGNNMECFMTVYVDSHLQVIDFEIVEGTVDRAMVYPRNLVLGCTRHHASGAILIHNHPSGVCKPSAEDRDVTDKILKVFNVAGIRLVDHVIISRAGALSMYEAGLIRQQLAVAEPQTAYRGDQ